MTQQTQYYPFGGGLDQITPAIALKPGNIIGGSNYEPKPDGYARILGFERFDGRPSPSAASFWQLKFKSGTAIITQGQTVTGATSGATGVALADATVTSGAYGTSDAAGYLGLGLVSGTFIDGENLRVGGVGKSVADGTAQLQESPDDATGLTWQLQAIENARGLIAAVPGSGPVRGVWLYNSNRYAFRDNIGGTAGVVYKSSAAGWVAVTLSQLLRFTSGGTYVVKAGDTIKGHISNATAVVQRVVTLTGDWSAGTAAGYVVFASQTGTFQAETLDVGANINVADIAGNSATITLPPGGRYEFLNHNFYGSSNLLRMYGVNAVGPGFEFDGTIFCPIEVPNMPVDTPTRIAIHRQALFFAFPGGSVQFSAVGDPLNFDGIVGAGEIGIGDEITGFLSNTMTSLAIFGKNSVNILYGSSSLDYQLQTLTEESGGFAWSADKVGDAIYMDKGGIRSLTATPAYGNFTLGTVSRLVSPLLEGKIAAGVVPVGTARLRVKNQLRIFFSDFTGIAINLGGKSPESMPLDLGKLVTSICSVETDTGEEIYFGSDDGFVYQMEKGNSFDGSDISYWIRLPFVHLGSPQQRKRFHKVAVECDCQANMTLQVSVDFDYGDPNQLSDDVTVLSLSGGGGAWDNANWDQFYWSAPFEGTGEAWIDGVGRNMSLLIGDARHDQAPHTLQGITYFYSMRGFAR